MDSSVRTYIFTGVLADNFYAAFGRVKINV